MLFPQLYSSLLLLLLNIQTLSLALPMYLREPGGFGPPNHSRPAGLHDGGAPSPPTADVSLLSRWYTYADQYRRLVTEMESRGHTGSTKYQATFAMLDLGNKAVAEITKFQQDFLEKTKADFGGMKDTARGNIASELLIAIQKSKKHLGLISDALMGLNPDELSKPIVTSEYLEQILAAKWPGDYEVMILGNKEKLHLGVKSGLPVKTTSPPQSVMPPARATTPPHAQHLHGFGNSAVRPSVSRVQTLPNQHSNTWASPHHSQNIQSFSTSPGRGSSSVFTPAPIGMGATLDQYGSTWGAPAHGHQPALHRFGTHMNPPTHIRTAPNQFSGVLPHVPSHIHQPPLQAFETHGNPSMHTASPPRMRVPTNHYVNPWGVLTHDQQLPPHGFGTPMNLAGQGRISSGTAPMSATNRVPGTAQSRNLNMPPASHWSQPTVPATHFSRKATQPPHAAKVGSGTRRRTRSRSPPRISPGPTSPRLRDSPPKARASPGWEVASVDGRKTNLELWKELTKQYRDLEEKMVECGKEVRATEEMLEAAQRAEVVIIAFHKRFMDMTKRTVTMDGQATVDLTRQTIASLLQQAKRRSTDRLSAIRRTLADPYPHEEQVPIIPSNFAPPGGWDRWPGDFTEMISENYEKLGKVARDVPEVGKPTSYSTLEWVRV